MLQILCSIFVLYLDVLTCLFVQALVQPTGLKGQINGWHRVAAYPSYGAGADGWRHAFVVSANVRAREGVAGFWVWFVAAARAVKPDNLLGPLPGGL